jgi:probable F420-dependent oxidoreductase
MPDQLKFGLTSINMGATSYPDALVRIAQAAETAGFDSLWAGEHHVLAESSSRIPATNRILNPVVALTFVAVHTRSVRLGTGILLLPQHQPLILAKELASLDVLSGSRLMVGIGVGWAEAEYEALGVPYRERGARADEYLAAMRAIWSEEKPAYHGRYVSFEGVQAFPHPVQQPTPPIVMGGRAPAVLRRTVEHANGWYGFSLGNYIRTYMTPSVVAMRILGTVITHLGAWYRKPFLLPLGFGLVLLGWLRGLLWPKKPAEGKGAEALPEA